MLLPFLVFQINQLPFPAVAICPKLPFDRFAAIRGILDEVKASVPKKGFVPDRLKHDLDGENLLNMHCGRT